MLLIGVRCKYNTILSSWDYSLDAVQSRVSGNSGLLRHHHHHRPTHQQPSALLARRLKAEEALKGHRRVTTELEAETDYHITELLIDRSAIKY